MKNLILVEDTTLRFSGILQAVSPTIQLHALQAIIPDGQVRMLNGKFHLTLIHQSLLKKCKKNLKGILPALRIPPFRITVDPILREGWYRHHSDETLDSFRSGFAMMVAEEDQPLLRDWCNNLLGRLGVAEREDREFHISVSNLTGKGGDSLR